VIHLFSYSFVQLALLAALVLAGIHSYLGFHVVSRGVIFVDISMAQAAAFGAVVAMVLGFGAHSWAEYFISLFFTLAAAGLISIARTRDNRIPQEAFIGIIFAGFSAMAILLLANHPGGTEELEETLTGSLLTMRLDDLISTAILYTIIGAFHYLMRARFFRLSEDRAGAVRDGWSIGWLDFLFYASFGLVVTSSVHIAGVLLVFSFLVIPPVIALLFTRSKGTRLAIGWLIGFLGSFLGIVVSIGLNLPAGPSIIGSLIFLLLIAVIAVNLVGALNRKTAIHNVAEPFDQTVDMSTLESSGDNA
jgi:zinc/manganese transport system permease protein